MRLSHIAYVVSTYMLFVLKLKFCWSEMKQNPKHNTTDDVNIYCPASFHTMHANRKYMKKYEVLMWHGCVMLCQQKPIIYWMNKLIHLWILACSEMISAQIQMLIIDHHRHHHKNEMVYLLLFRVYTMYSVHSTQTWPQHTSAAHSMCGA